MLSGFSPLPAPLVMPLKNAFFSGMHPTNYACGQHILWALRNADSVAGISAQMSIFMSGRLHGVCQTSAALTPRKKALIPALLGYLPQAKGLRLPLLEQAIGLADDKGGMSFLRTHAAQVLPVLVRGLSDPKSDAPHASDSAVRIGWDIGMYDSSPAFVSLCGIPETKVGLAIYRINAMGLESRAIIEKLLASIDNPDPATHALAMSALVNIRDRGTQKEVLRKALQGSKGERARQFLGT